MLISHGLALAHLLRVLKVQPVEFASMDYRLFLALGRSYTRLAQLL